MILKIKPKRSRLSAKNAEGETGLEPLFDRGGSDENANEALKPPNVFGEALRAELDLLASECGGSPKQHPHKVAGEQRKYLRDPELSLRDFRDFGFESDAQVLRAAQDLASRKGSLTPEERAAWWMCQRPGGERDDNEPIERLLLSLRYARAREILRRARGTKGSRGNRRCGKVN